MAPEYRTTFVIHILAICTLWLATLPGPAAAQDDAAGDRALIEAQTVYESLMSPYCPGRLLRDCPSGQATQLKDRILERTQGGETADKIREDLIGNYGEEMRAAPKHEGFGLVAWYGPFLFLAVGVAILLIWLRLRRAAPSDYQARAADPEATRRVEEELARISRSEE